jgi:dimeric dUTPase (all-alpha-NTP-PPase superfamily)
MTKEEQILKMFEMQEKLNNETNGPAWKGGVAKNGKTINWRRAIWLEAAEAVESFGWKHWKDIAKEVDRENVKVEVVDIWHFAMSDVLASMDSDVPEIIVGALGSMGSFVVPDDEKTEKISTDEQQMQAFENMAEEAFSSRSEHSLVNTFFILCDRVGLTMDELYSMYMSKNMLNSLRQELGYQEGTYQKEWICEDISPMPVEDNRIILHMFRENPEMELEELKELYKEEYKKETEKNTSGLKP